MIGQTLGHYRILEKIGAGGMGVVYRAHDERLDREVAVKVLPFGTLENDLARRHFRKEALALAKLNHPNIEAVYEFGSEGGTDYLVMEFVPGPTLAQRLADGPLPERGIVALGIEIVGAIGEAHEHGIIHRDLKPSNIALARRGQAKVLDFGLAKWFRPEQDLTTDFLTESGAIAGTYPYMSPEQLRGEPLDSRSDIHAIGALFYEMSTGRKAFSSEQLSMVIDAILHQMPPLPRTLNGGITVELERIILKCLDKDADNRYQSTKELLVDLRRLATSSSSHAMPASSPRAVSKWKSRVRYVGIGVAAVLVLAITLTAMNLTRFQRTILDRIQTPEIHSVAVLPLDIVSGGREEEYLADGVTDALIMELAQVGELRVISRTSVMVYKNAKKPLPQIAKELGVDAVVEGSVQRSENKVRINAELIQASTDRLLWAKSYQRDLRDILTLQSAIAQAIVGEVKVKVTPLEKARLARSYPVNTEAHEAYLAGRFYWNKQTADGLTKSISYFEQAIANDPHYALAYAGLADSYHALPELTTVRVGEALPKARSAALKALELDDSLAEAHSALATIREDFDWDWLGAESEYKRAIELNPGYSAARVFYSNLLMELGRLSEARSEARIAQELDPLSVLANDNLSAIFYYCGEYDESISQSRRTLEIDPLSHQAHRHLGQAYAQKRLYSDAISELQTAAQLSHESDETMAELGYVLGLSGRKPEARQIVQKLNHPPDNYTSQYRLAVVYIGLGEPDKALASLERAVEVRSPGVVHLKVSPLFRDLRANPRFQGLLTNIGLNISSEQ